MVFARFGIAERANLPQSGPVKVIPPELILRGVSPVLVREMVCVGVIFPFGPLKISSEVLSVTWAVNNWRDSSVSKNKG